MLMSTSINMTKKYTKKQQEAIKSLCLNIDELDNKPRRLFKALREFTEAFQEDHSDERTIEVLDSIDEIEHMYYHHIHIPEMTRGILEKKRKVEKEFISVKRWKDKRDEYNQGFEDGVLTATKALSAKIVNAIINDEF
jgi:hypothetical protein